MKKFLVISPHPDDLDFGCAGTIAKLAKAENIVEELIVSDGSKGSHVLGFGGKKLAKIREREEAEAAKVLHAHKVYFLRKVDGTLENTPVLRKSLVRMIRLVKPDVVLSFDPTALNSFESAGRSHRDHRQVAEAVFDAVYPAAGNISFFPELRLKPHSVKELWCFGTFKPTRIENISKTIDLKIRALLCHKSQIKEPKAMEKRIRDWARNTGRKKGMRYAEGFRVLTLS